MEAVFRSEDLPVADRFTWWREMACQAHVPTMVRSDREADFRATLRVLDFGAIQVSSLAHPSLRVQRTWKAIRQSDPGMYCLALPLRGTMRFAQSDREAEFGPQDLMLYDTSRPFRGWISTDGNDDIAHMIMQIPRSALPLPPGKLSRLTAIRLPGTGGIGALLSSHLGELARQAAHYTAADAARLSSLTLDLLGALCAHHLEAGACLSSEARQQVLQAQIRDFIQQRLGDPDLTADTIAAAHHISTRYLYKLFQDQDLSVAGWIRQRRLERCRHDLADPQMRSRPIHSIAARWGFTDGAHFSRVFRAAYGISPGTIGIWSSG
jgi:AraC-like DNA-binding protein